MTVPLLLQAEGLSVEFPVRGGLLKREIARLRAVDNVSVSLRSGDTRLELHLGLKLARLIGALPAPPGAGRQSSSPDR